MHLSELRGRRVAVWGTGREAMAAINAIEAYAPAEMFTVQDKTTFLAREWTGHLAEIAPIHQGDAAREALRKAEIVVRSPGVGESNPWIKELRDRGVPITSGTALWMADHAHHAIGVTGSKGKSTTTSLIHHVLAAVGRPSTIGGNIGIAVLDLPPADLYVIELSMYQCADLDDSPRLVGLTSLYEEHLDWTRDHLPAQYYAHKLNIVEHGPEAVVFNATDPTLRAELAARPGLPLVAAGSPDTFHVRDGWFHLAGEPLFPRSDLPLAGRHNEGNLCVALGVMQAAGVDCVAERDRIAAGLRTFQALPHRLTEIADPSGVTFVDDSISTIPQATIHAIDAYAGRPLTVIVGGQDRGIDYGPLRDFVMRDRRDMTFIGVPDNGPRILATAVDAPHVTTVLAADLADAVRLARVHTPPGGVVLLSPAAPSYDHFDNFEARAKAFRAAVEASAP
jgi:UDP-N-acetylmuramoylalanine--D-glutamate ligase